MKAILTAITLGLGALIALPAQAQSFIGQTRGLTPLRAGPDIGYPQVAVLPGNASVRIYGCVDDWTWCDVEWANDRGWVSAGMLDTRYSGRVYTVGSSGYDIGIPILGFLIHEYWDHHYRTKHWYRDNNRWFNYRPARVYVPPKYRPVPPIHRPPVVRPLPPVHRPIPTPPVNRPVPPRHDRPDWGNGGHRPGTQPRPPVNRPAPAPSDPRGHRPDRTRGGNDRGPGPRGPDRQGPPRPRQQER